MDLSRSEIQRALFWDEIKCHLRYGGFGNMDQIGVGTHIIIPNSKGEILLGKRKKKLGHGEWELPGGHVEFRETFEDNLVRECKEELGIDVEVGDLVSVSPNLKYEHHIVFTFLAKSFIGEPKLMEPDKHYVWKWFSLNNLPEPLFIYTRFAIDNYLSKKIYQKRGFKVG